MITSATTRDVGQPVSGHERLNNEQSRPCPFNRQRAEHRYLIPRPEPSIEAAEPISNALTINGNPPDPSAGRSEPAAPAALLGRAPARGTRPGVGLELQRGHLVDDQAGQAEVRRARTHAANSHCRLNSFA